MKLEHYSVDDDVIAEDKSMIQYGAVDSVPEMKRFRKERHNRNKDVMTEAQIKAGMAGLWRDGKEYEVIAKTISDEYGVKMTANNVQYHIKSMLKRWRDLCMARVDEKQAMLLTKIDQIEQLATLAYFSSMSGRSVTMIQKQIDRARSLDNQEDIRKNVKKERKDMKRAKGKDKPPIILIDEGEMLDTMIVTQEKIKEYLREEHNAAGDAKFLQILLDCNRQRAQLWNMFNVRPPDDQDAVMVKMTDEDRQNRLAAILNAAAQRRSADVGALAPASPLDGFGEDEDGNDLTPDDAGDVLKGEFFNYTNDSDEDEDDWG